MSTGWYLAIVVGRQKLNLIEQSKNIIVIRHNDSNNDELIMRYTVAGSTNMYQHLWSELFSSPLIYTPRVQMGMNCFSWARAKRETEIEKSKRGVCEL